VATFDFSRLADIERIAGDKVDEVIRGTLLDMTRRVIFRTPVKTGRARGNWQATINNPATGPVTGVDTAGNSTLAEAAPITEVAPGNVYYLTNNLPYAERLEFGWSQQAPSGMVRITLSELDRSIREQIARLPK